MVANLEPFITNTAQIQIVHGYTFKLLYSLWQDASLEILRENENLPAQPILKKKNKSCRDSLKVSIFLCVAI